MRRLPASSVFRLPELGKQGLRIKFRYQGIISYRVVEAFEPLGLGSCQLSFGPTFAQAWYNLGDLLDDQGRTDAAIECLRKGLRVAPDAQMQCSTSPSYYSEKPIC